MREAVVAVLLVTTGLTGCIGAMEDLSPTSASDAVEDEPTTGFTDTHVYEGEYVTDEPYSLTLEEGPFEAGETGAMYLESEVDGKAIEIGVVKPDVPDDEQVPVVAFASPYLNPIHGQDLLELRPRLTENFVDHGYAVAFVAVRGTGDSGGCSHLMGPVERSDVSQAVTWLGEQDWSNGNVGMLGVSYDGSTPWEVAAEGNEHLATIVPISGVNDPFQLMYTNGSAESRGAAVLNGAYYAYGFGIDNPTEGRSAERTIDGALCPEAKRGLAASLHSTATGERDPTGYWAERNMRPLVEENYNGSIFLVHGLQDWNVDPGHAMPWVHDRLDHEQDLKVKYWLGQWFHAWPDGDYLDQPTRRVDFAEVLLHWFDSELKGEDVDLGPKVQVQDSTGQWRSGDHWPPQNATERTLHPTAEGELAEANDTDEGTVTVGPSASPASNQPLAYQGGAASQIPCEGCAEFRTAELDEPGRFAGTPTFHADVTPTGPGGYLSAFLYAQEGGEYTRLGWTSMDLRFHDGGDQAQPVVPGERVTAKMQFEPLDAVVPEGAQLVLVVTEGGHADRVSTSAPAPVQLHVGADVSPLTMQTFTVSEEDTFASPAE
jgi:putative CocE/NonD family hydrolase